MRRASGYKIFIKYLLSYLIILILPIMVMSFVVSRVFIDNLQEEMISGNLNTLDKVRYALDDQWKRVKETTYQLILEDNHLAQYKVSDDPGYRAWGIVSELKRYQKMNPFVHDIWLYYRGQESVYTSSAVYPLSVLTGQAYPFGDWPEAQAVNDISSLQDTMVLPPASVEGSYERFMRILVPIFPYQNKPYGTLVFLVNEKSIQALLANHTQTGGSTWVLNQEGRVITGLGDAKEIGSETVSALTAENAGSSYRKVAVGNKDYYLFAIKSAQSGWSYITLLPVRLVLDKVNQSQRLFMYGVTFILLLGGAVIFFSMRSNYSPIRRLKLDTERMFPPTEKPLNELETVRHALSSLVHLNHKLDERVKSHSTIDRKQLLLSLIKGDVLSEEQCALLVERMNVHFSGSFFRIAVIEFLTKMTKGQYPSLETIEQLLSERLQGFGMEHLDRDRNRYLFLIEADSRLSEEFRSAIEELRDSLRLVAEGAVTIGIGTASMLPDIPRSYLEACTAIDYRFIRGNDRTIYFEDIPADRTFREEYPLKEMEELRQSMRAGNMFRVRSSLSAMLSYVRSKQPPLVVTRGLIFDILRTANTTWTEMGLQPEDTGDYPDIFSLEQLETIDDFEQLIQLVILQLCETIKAEALREPSEGERSLNRMIEYIQSHYRNCDFSFQNMSREFGMALPNLSQYYKDQTGQTLMDYLTQLRMERAKQLLTEQADAPLKAIAEQVGYYNVSSFIRRFKQLTGLTPRDYRQQAKIDAS